MTDVQIAKMSRLGKLVWLVLVSVATVFDCRPVLISHRRKLELEDYEFLVKDYLKRADGG